MPMEGLAIVMVLLAVSVSWLTTTRAGVLAGAAVPGLVALAFWVADSQGSTHAEAAMGRGMAALFFWLPAFAGAVIGVILGALNRRKG